jgi:hypothetical protein
LVRRSFFVGVAGNPKSGIRANTPAPKGKDGMKDVGCNVGDQVELVACSQDECPIHVGERGVVRSMEELADGRTMVWVDWDSKQRMTLTIPSDRFLVTGTAAWDEEVQRYIDFMFGPVDSDQPEGSRQPPDNASDLAPDEKESME